MGVLAPLDGAHQRELHVEGQRGRDTVRVDFLRGQPLGLEEDLVLVSLRETHDLVLDRWTVTWSDTLDHTRE